MSAPKIVTLANSKHFKSSDDSLITVAVYAKEGEVEEYWLYQGDQFYAPTVDAALVMAHNHFPFTAGKCLADFKEMITWCEF